MKKFILFFLISLTAFFSVAADAADSDAAYQQARECYNSLKSDEARQKMREPWEDCIGQFENVKKKFGRSADGANAAYTLGRLYEGLAENSKNRADWLMAISKYDNFTTRYPVSSMTDDAYFRAGKIYWERLRDKKNAEKNMIKIIRFFKTSDMAGEADKYLSAIRAGIVPAEELKPVSQKSRAFVKPRPVSPVKSEKRGAERLTIVIDPGHGGSDTGAIGPSGIEEKDVVLALSRRLAEELKKRLPSSQILLTRNDDETLTLDDRVKFANLNGADLFISMHANASESEKQHGVQTYYLNNASDRAAEKLAAQENKQSGKSSTDLDKIISTMIQNASAEDSRELAASVHSSLVAGLSKKYSGIADQKVRSALFYVLVGVKCPAILVETSYISHPKEEKRLINEDYQKTIASAIAGGVQNKLRSVNSLAHNL